MLPGTFLNTSNFFGSHISSAQLVQCSSFTLQSFCCLRNMLFHDKQVSFFPALLVHLLCGFRMKTTLLSCKVDCLGFCPLYTKGLRLPCGSDLTDIVDPWLNSVSTLYNSSLRGQSATLPLDCYELQ